MSKETILRKIQKQKDYLDKKINGHGGCMHINWDTGRVTTDYVGLKGNFEIFLINIKLWLIWKLG